MTFSLRFLSLPFINPNSKTLKKNFLKLSSLFLFAPSAPVSFPPFDAAPIFSPPQQRAPLRPHLLFSTASFPLPGTALFLPSPLPFPAPFLHSPTHALPAPLVPRHLSLGALPAFWHRPSPAPNATLPFGTVQPNRTEQRASVRSCLAKRRAMAEQRPSVRPNKTERKASFGLVWPNSAGREGVLGTVPKNRGGALGESMCRGVGEDYEKKEGDGREGGGAEEGEGGGTGNEMYRGSGGVEREKKDSLEIFIFLK